MSERLNTALSRNMYVKRAGSFMADLRNAVPFTRDVELVSFEEAQTLLHEWRHNTKGDVADTITKGQDDALARFRPSSFAAVPEEFCYLRFSGEEGFTIRLAKEDLFAHVQALLEHDGDTILALSPTHHAFMLDQTENDGTYDYYVRAWYPPAHLN